MSAGTAHTCVVQSIILINKYISTKVEDFITNSGSTKYEDINELSTEPIWQQTKCWGMNESGQTDIPWEGEQELSDIEDDEDESEHKNMLEIDVGPKGKKEPRIKIMKKLDLDEINDDKYNQNK